MSEKMTALILAALEFGFKPSFCLEYNTVYAEGEYPPEGPEPYEMIYVEPDGYYYLGKRYTTTEAVLLAAKDIF